MSKPKKRTVATLSKQLEAGKKNIAKERDKLRELIEEATTIEGNCADALDDIERAADSLSQYL